jgi:hypothetical protein
MSAHEKARRGFPPGRNFGVSISLIDGFDDHVNDFDPPARVSSDAFVRSLSLDWADDQASCAGSPLILMSNFGLGLDYILMAMAPRHLWGVREPDPDEFLAHDSSLPVWEFESQASGQTQRCWPGRAGFGAYGAKADISRPTARAEPVENDPKQTFQGAMVLPTVIRDLRIDTDALLFEQPAALIQPPHDIGCQGARPRRARRTLRP